MFGDEEYLEMFLEVYSSAMQYLQLPINIRNHSFLVDVHMDSGEDRILNELGEDPSPNPEAALTLI